MITRDTWSENLHRQVERAVDLAKDLYGAQAAGFEPAMPLPWLAIAPAPAAACDANRRVISQGESLFLPDDGEARRAYLGVPVLTADGVVLGALFVTRRKAAARQRPPSPHRLKKLAAMIGAAHDNSRARAVAGSALATAEILVASVPLSVMMTDLDCRLLDATDPWLDDFGVGRAEAIGKILYEFAPDHFPKFRPMFDRCLAGETVKVGRLRLPDRDGVFHWLQAELNPWRHKDGKIGGMIGAAINITDTVEALERSELSEKRLQVAMELAEFRVWEMDQDGLLQGGVDSAAAPAMASKVPGVGFYARGQDMLAQIHPDDQKHVGADWYAALAEHRPFRAEFRHPSPGGDIWFEAASQEVCDDTGQVTRIVGVSRDISERKRAECELITAKEDAEAANRAKSAFLATMSHEIRTPLNGVLGMAQAMAADELAPVQRERIEVIRQSGQGLLSILNDVLDMAKIEAGKLELEEINFDLAKVIAGAESTFRTLADAKGLEMLTRMDDSIRGAFHGDPSRLRQVIYNLISNALKFTERGCIEVSAAWTEGELTLRVSDTGIGIPEDVLQQVFHRFSQADASTTRRFGGTGLGLAISRDLVGMMGGTLEAESAEGQGTTFTVTLPLPRVSHVEAAVEPAPAAMADEPERDLRVLAAEDNSVNRLVLKTLLNQVGIEPVMVENGADAVDAWRTSEWDIILMDIQMPLMDGMTAARMIRSEELGLTRPRTPIIALTANAMTHQVAEYRHCGMDGHVAKPIEAATLYGTLQAVLERPGETEAAA